MREPPPPARPVDGDAIHIQYADRIWIDHNNLSSDMTHGKDFYDGLVDITHASDSPPYSFTLIPASQVASTVTAGAGTGKI